jgi:hypothetical protein
MYDTIHHSDSHKKFTAFFLCSHLCETTTMKPPASSLQRLAWPQGNNIISSVHFHPFTSVPRHRPLCRDHLAPVACARIFGTTRHFILCPHLLLLCQPPFLCHPSHLWPFNEVPSNRLMCSDGQELPSWGAPTHLQPGMGYCGSQHIFRYGGNRGTAAPPSFIAILVKDRGSGSFKWP